MNLVANGQRERALGAVCGGHGNRCAVAVVNSAEVFVFHGGCEHRGYVARGRVQIARPTVEIEAMGVLKNRIRAAQLLCLLVHGLNERGIGVGGRRVDLGSSGDGDCRCRIVAAHDHEARKCVLHGEDVSLQKAQARFAHRCRGVVDRDDIGKLAVLKRHEGGHDLGDRGDLDGLVRIALIVGQTVLAQHHGMWRGDVGQFALHDAAVRRRGPQDDVTCANFSMGWCGEAGEKGEGCGEGCGDCGCAGFSHKNLFGDSEARGVRSARCLKITANDVPRIKRLLGISLSICLMHL